MAAYGELWRRGNPNGNPKLTKRQVQEIRELRSIGVYRKIVAEWYGVSESCIYDITSGDSWDHKRTPTRYPGGGRKAA